MQINPSEVLRYLGYRGKPADQVVRNTIASCSEELLREAAPRQIYRRVALRLKEDRISFAGITIHSRDLAAHLSGCGEAYLFAATLGARVDICLERCSRVSMARAVVMQACAASLIESWCDECEIPLSQEAATDGLYLRPRYSPGYGDFSIEHQREVLALLDCARRINLTMTEGYMLTPTKSVTAIIGLTPDKTSCHIRRCMNCTAKNCPFRKEDSQ